MARDLHIGDSFMTEDIVRGIITQLANNGGTKYTYKAIAEVVDAFKDVVTNALADGFKVQIMGFLTMEPKYAPPRVANDLYSKSVVEVPERVNVQLKAGKGIKELRYKYTPEQLTVLREIWESKNPDKA